jgi:hypothetical protein
MKCNTGTGPQVVLTALTRRVFFHVVAMNAKH